MIPSITTPTISDLHISDAQLDRFRLLRQYQTVRARTEWIAEPLEIEDCVIQTSTVASPVKWQLGHTTWFFETFVLKSFLTGYTEFHEKYSYLFNSYYNTIGERVARPIRGLMSRPTVREVMEYRRYVDEAMKRLLSTIDEATMHRLQPVITLGMHHEEQHEELILTDVKTVLAMNPLRPIYREREIHSAKTTMRPIGWHPFDEALTEIGAECSESFYFDNEGPRHKEYLAPFRLADRLVTNREFKEFIEDGGYESHALWLSDGWTRVQEEGWQSPMYWERDASTGEWWNMTLQGFRPVSDDEPVTHISYYEADAFAAWYGARLATEAEWEHAAWLTMQAPSADHNLLERANFHPVPLEVIGSNASPIYQLFGDVWEWTRSAYLPYPGYHAAEGALGEYNGKFMSGQMVLRGGSCVTPQSHIRASYRNFFPPESRWQFSGIRLAKDR